MVFENPVIDARALIRSIDPVQPRREVYAALRKANVISHGISLGVPSNEPLVVHCSLNRDAVAAARHGDTSAVRAIRRHAQRIETEILAPWVHHAGAAEHASETLTRGADAPEPDWIEVMLFAESAQGREVVPAVLEAAQAVAEARSDLATSAVPRRIAGRVWSIDETFSEIRAEKPTEEPFPVFTSEVLELGLRLGDPVIVTYEPLDRGMMLTTLERGLETVVRRHPLTGRTSPPHLEQLLAGSPPPPRRSWVRPLRRLAQ